MHIVNGRSIGDVLYAGSIIGVLAIVNFLLVFERAGEAPFGGGAPFDPALIAQATTMTYVTVLVCQLCNITQRRSDGGLFSRYTFTNPTYWLACAAGVTIMLAIVYVPWVQAVFGTAGLGILDWLFVLLAAAVFVAIREITRLVRRSRVSR